MIRPLVRLFRSIYYGVTRFVFERAVLNVYLNKGEASLSVMSGLEIVDVSNKEKYLLVSCIGDYLTQNKFESRIQRGDACFAAFFNDKPVHFSWVSFDKAVIREVRKSYHLSQEQAYIYHCFTHPEFRGRDIYPIVLARIVKGLQLKGKKHFFISTAANNLASQKGILKAGFHQVESIIFLRILGFKFYNNKLIGENYGQYLIERKNP
ncbi:MAG: hypothetical protein KJ880_07795 [Candidatus Omnitrophica bacterium]|nr:hypothetical protein [Candidatus Omnitrophota bacterium]MBU1869144.1 hypothetical protein [Candidatus Omnitrophota bacterium]